MDSCRTAPGFSLIEIIIAVSIMALVAGLVVPNLVSYLRSARTKSTRIAIKNVQDAIQSFHADTGTYPASLVDLKTRPAEEKAARHWDGPYIQKEPVDAWHNELVYTLNPKGTQPPYELYSWGANGEGSKDDEWIRAED